MTSGTVDAPGFDVADEVAAALPPGVDTIGLLLQPGAEAAAVAAAAVRGRSGPVVRMLRWPLPSRGGAIGMLVRGSALTAARRTASTAAAAAVLLTVAFAVLVREMG